MGAGLSARAYWPAIAWAILILVATTWPNAPDVGPQGTDKVLHFGVFLILGALLAPTLSSSGLFSRRVLASFAVILLFAAVDEIIQMAVPGRFASIADWSADAIGAVAGLSLAVIPKLRRKNST